MNDLAIMAWEGQPRYSELSDAGRIAVRNRCLAIERLLKAPSKGKGKAVEREARALGVGKSTFRLWARNYQDTGGDWTSQIDNRLEPHTEDALPPEFVTFWKTLVEANKRKIKPAWKLLRRLFWTRATEYKFPEGELIPLWPGYAEWPEVSPSSPDDLPRGWSYSNLTRPCYCPTKHELTLARIGPIAASDYEEMIFTTRENLKPGQFYVFDDCWSDVMVTVAPHISRIPVRPVELGCGDIFSGKKIAWGVKPMVKDDEGTREFLRKRDMRYLLARVFCTIGFHRDGVVNLIEHGTATVEKDLREYLFKASGGKITFRESGIKGGKAFGGGYETIGKGNFRLKAGYESQHNLCHNERGALPGQVGSNSRLNAPEDLQGRTREATLVLTAMQEMRPEAAKAMATGFMTFSDYFWSHELAEKHIGDYTDHELQGWLEAGLVVAEFRLDVTQPWLPVSKLLDLMPLQREAIQAFIQATPYCTRDRRLSRNEAWLRGKDELIRLPLHCVPLILGPELSKVRPVLDNHTFTFQTQEIGEDDCVYPARAKTSRGAVEHLVAGQQYRTWVNPFDERLLFIATLDGRYIGTCDLKERITHDNVEAFHQAAGKAAHVNKEVLKPFYRRAMKRLTDAKENRERNAAIAEGAPVTPDEIAVADYVTEHGGDPTTSRPFIPENIPPAEEPAAPQRPNYGGFLTPKQ